MLAGVRACGGWGGVRACGGRTGGRTGGERRQEEEDINVDREVVSDGGSERWR